MRISTISTGSIIHHIKGDVMESVGNCYKAKEFVFSLSTDPKISPLTSQPERASVGFWRFHASERSDDFLRRP
jgi:hypothetical protein